MIGVIVTGHGKYATGMESALRLLAGRPEKFTAVDFRQEDTIDDLEFRLRDAILDMSECTGILIMVDVFEGATFRESVEMKDKISNLPIEVSNVGDLADLAVDEGRKQTLRYVYSESEAEYDD